MSKSKILIPAFIFGFMVLFISTPVNADESMGFTGGRYSISVTALDNRQSNRDKEIIIGNLLRLINEGHLNQSTEFQFHVLNGFTLMTETSQDDAENSFSLNNQKYRALDLTWEILDEPTLSSFISIDRLNAKIALPQVDITIGRQAITFGKAWFWNPLDVYLPFDASAIDRDYKAGVDAIRIDVPTGNFSGMNFVLSAGHEIDLDNPQKKNQLACDWYGSSVLGRYYTSIEGWDYAVQAGKIYGGYQAGCGLVGEISEYQFRMEASYLFAKDSPMMPEPYTGNLFEDHAELVLGIGRIYPDNLDIEMEYLYNDAAESDDLDAGFFRVANGASKHISKNLLGVYASKEINPLLYGRVMCIVSLSDNSFQIQPNLTYSVSANSDFLVGLVLNFGKRPDRDDNETSIRSEFGSYPDIFYVEYKKFF